MLSGPSGLGVASKRAAWRRLHFQHHGCVSVIPKSFEIWVEGKTVLSRTPGLTLYTVKLTDRSWLRCLRRFVHNYTATKKRIIYFHPISANFTIILWS